MNTWHPPAAAGPQPPSRDDNATMRTCPACGQAFTPSGRRRWCSDACKHAAWRRRSTPALTQPPLPPTRRKRDLTVYECAACGYRSLGSQRCDDCGTFMRAVGAGGTCPHCEEPVAVQELIPPQQ